ncbi:MAG: hypothetical protein ACK6DZ_07510 [Acidobacteriota bacterium]
MITIISYRQQATHTGYSDFEVVEVMLEGDGMALAACGRLLAGYCRVGRLAGPGRARLPVVLMNGTSWRLYGDIFGRERISGGWPILKRVVRWGGETREFPHEALVVSEQELLAGAATEVEEAAAGQFRVVGSRGPMELVGERQVGLWRGRLKSGAPGDTCWMEATESGWMFAAATSEREAVVMAAGGELEGLMGESKLVGGVVEAEEELGRLGSEPGMARVMRGSDWVGCGGAALRFDPICGEGRGPALREGILVSAILRRRDRNEAMWEMYEDRLRAGFWRHLRNCLEFYRSGGRGEWWRKQAGELEGALGRYEHVPAATRWRLEGFELVG